MNERKPTSEIEADLRSPKDAWARYDDSDADHPDGIETLQEFRWRLEREAADRLAELEVSLRAAIEQHIARDALRLPCPTCDGTQRVVFRCVDCSDGLMTHEWAWKIVAAVFEYADDQLPTTADAYRSYLRGIR